MKSINLIENENKNKNKKNKIKNAFKKIGEYTLIAAAAFTFSCGGTDTDGRSKTANVLSPEMRAYVEEKNLSVYDATKDKLVRENYDPVEELYILKEEINSLCHKKYPSSDIIQGTYSPFAFIDENPSVIKEFYMKSNTDFEGGNVVEGLKYDDVYVKFVQARARSPPGIFYYYIWQREDKILGHRNLHGFRYIKENTPENIKGKPYVNLCLYYYDNVEKFGEALGRFIVIPNEMFWQKVDSLGISRERVMEHFETINDSFDK